jgi:hypothetical protein
MSNIESELELNKFDVVLIFEHNSWTFLTCAYTSEIELAVEQAEREFSIHSLHHRIRNVKASSAYVDGHFLYKRNGKWQTADASIAPTSTARLAEAAPKSRPCREDHRAAI